jgi:hypothetical protein
MKKYARIKNNPERFITIDSTTGCWLWTKSMNKNGYGYFRINGQRVLAHRYFYEKKYGKITAPFPYDVLDHIVCGRRNCCNPEHVKPSSVGKNWGRESIIVRRNKSFEK